MIALNRTIKYAVFAVACLLINACSNLTQKEHVALKKTENVSIYSCLPNSDGTLDSPADCNSMYRDAVEGVWEYSIFQSGPAPGKVRQSSMLNNAYQPPEPGSRYSAFVTYTSAGDPNAPAGLFYDAQSLTYKTLNSRGEPKNVWVSQLQDFRSGFCSNIKELKQQSPGQKAEPEILAGYASSLLQGLPPVWLDKSSGKWTPSYIPGGYPTQGLYVIFLPYTEKTEIQAVKRQNNGTIIVDQAGQRCTEGETPCIVRVSVNGVGLSQGKGSNYYPQQSSAYDKLLWGVAYDQSWPFAWITENSYYQKPGKSFSCGSGEYSCIDNDNILYPWTGLGKTGNWLYYDAAQTMVDRGGEEFIMPANLSFKNTGTQPTQFLNSGQTYKNCNPDISSFCFIPTKLMEQALCR